MKKVLTSRSLFLAACFLPFILNAQNADAPRERGGDGTPRERGAHIRAHMERIDANGDGNISREEALNSGNPERAQLMFDRLDANNDGLITSEERRAAMRDKIGKGRKQKGGAGKDCSACQG